MITIAAARALYTTRDSVHDFDHILRVHALALHIARVEGADEEIVGAAALLHDIARVDGDATGTDHAALAATRVRALLAGQVPERVEAVVHAVEAHRFRGTTAPATLEARVLFDADKLDAIGAVGVARAFAYGGLHGAPLWADVPLPGVDAGAAPGERPPGEHTPVHEFVYKLSAIPARLHTETGRRLAEERLAVMRAFYVRLRVECRGEG